VLIETVETSVVVGLETNCYLVADEATRDAVVIDPGGSPASILQRIAQLRLKVNLIINTHGHFDHISADQEVMDAAGAALAAHRDALPLFKTGGGAALFGIRVPQPPLPTRLLQDGDLLTFGGETLQVLHTPGHSAGCICLWSESSAVVFDGDLLFRGGIGRSDLPGGNEGQLLRSIQEKILTLPDTTVVYPGHGPSTTVGRERKLNPFLL
jgi:glyoxylase-like metal-dependent hydrolase (beta-lactamase superfamily II)